MRRVFSVEGELYSGFTFIYKLILLNIYCILGSLGIVTIGVSLTALYHCVFKIQEKKDGQLWKEFIKSYRENLRQGMLLTLIILFFFFVSVGVVGLGITVFSNQLVAFVGLLNCAVCLFISNYSFMLLAQFHNTVGKILMNSVFLLFKNVGIAIVIFLIPIFFLVFLPFYLPKLVFILIMTALSFVAYLQIYFFKKVIREFIITN